jgi:quercetin dioxygenase-like cupin family protein
MKRVLVGFVAALSSISAASAQDHSAHSASKSAINPGPANAQLVLDNASVTVIHVHMAPHEKTPMHDLTARVVVWLTDAHLRDTLATGETHDENAKAGDVAWVPAQRHQGENLGDNPIEFVAIIPKETAPSTASH